MGADLTKLTAPKPIPKHPNEDFIVGMDFSKILDDDAEISSVDSIEVSPDLNDDDLFSEFVSIDGHVVNINLSSGIADIDYIVTVTIVLADGQIRTGVGIVEVRLT